MVGMSEIKVTRRQTDVLTALGLGSCIGVCAYDAHTQVAGIAHVVLPESLDGNCPPGKFADTAVPELIAEMTKQGATANRLRIALVGGAQLFTGLGTSSKLDIGPRNAAAVQRVCQQLQIPVVATELGGNAGRTVYMFCDGRIRLKTLGQGEKEWINIACLFQEEARGRRPVLADAIKAPFPTASMSK